MTRINTNVPALIAVNDLNKNNQTLSTTLQRLSSGLRINSAGDDPSGLIISELLRSEIRSLSQAVSNSQRASNVLSTAEGALNEVSALLTTMASLGVQAANSGALTSEEIQAAQLQIDSAVQSITRIANTTSFGGTQLLNGALDYVTSGASLTNLPDLALHSVQFGTSKFIPVVVRVSSAAHAAGLAYMSPGLTANQNITLEISGKSGAETLSFIGSTHNSAIVFAINTVSDVTGVKAVLSGANLVMKSADLGSDSFVSVHALTGQFRTVLAETPATVAQRDTGTDAIVSVNGTKAVADGNRIRLNTNALSIEATLDPAFLGTTQFTVTGGGALFQLGGGVGSDEQVNLGIGSVAAGKLGSSDIGFLSDVVTGGRYSLTGGQATEALKIVNKAILQVATTRGRLGAFEANTVQTNINSLAVAIENANSAESTIRDTDFAAETANLTRAQILVSAGTSVLATANSTPQSILKLLQ